MNAAPGCSYSAGIQLHARDTSPTAGNQGARAIVEEQHGLVKQTRLLLRRKCRRLNFIRRFANHFISRGPQKTAPEPSSPPPLPPFGRKRPIMPTISSLPPSLYSLALPSLEKKLLHLALSPESTTSGNMRTALPKIPT